jgi:hypothetical protein
VNFSEAMRQTLVPVVYASAKQAIPSVSPAFPEPLDLPWELTQYRRS